MLLNHAMRGSIQAPSADYLCNRASPYYEATFCLFNALGYTLELSLERYNLTYRIGHPTREPVFPTDPEEAEDDPAIFNTKTNFHRIRHASIGS